MGHHFDRRQTCEEEERPMTHTVMKRHRLHHLYRGQGGGAAEVLASDSLVPAADHRTARCARRPVITSQGATESRRFATR